MTTLSRREIITTVIGMALAGVSGCTDGNLPADSERDGGSKPDDSPEVVAVSTETVDASCLGLRSKEIAVTLADELVEVTGGIDAPNPCYDATASAVVDASTLAIDVDVDPEDRAEECIQCTAWLEYAVTVELSGEGIEQVDVAHGDDGVQASVEANETPTQEPTDGNDTAG